MSAPSMAEAAVAYAAAGLHVVPLHGFEANGNCTCGKDHAGDNGAGKHPRLGNWQNSKAPTPETVAGYWRRWGERANIGLLAGASGHAVIDEDGPDAAAQLAALVGREGTAALAGAPRASSPRGAHTWVAAPAARAGRLGPELELKTLNVVVPPSRMADGTARAWLPGRSLLEVEAPAAPAALLAASARPEPAHADGGPIGEGEGRNDHLFSMGRALRSRGSSGELIEATLRAENEERCRPPLDERELGAVVRSVLDPGRPPIAAGAAAEVALSMSAMADIPAPANARQARSLAPLPFRAADDYLAEAPEEVDWIWRGYLARGAVTLLSGPPKRGKSTLVAELVEALRHGAARFLGRGLAPGPVVWAAEEGAGTLRDKITPGPGLVVLDRRGAFPRRPWPELVQSLGAEAERIGAVLVAIDTLPFWAALGAEAERDAGRMQEAMEPVLALAAAGFAVLLTHHDRKGGGADGEAARGSSAITATVDAVLDLARRPDGEDPSSRRTLAGLSRWADETPAALVFERQGDGALVALAEGDPSDVARRALDERVLGAVGQELVTAQGVAAALGVSDIRVRPALARLAAAGAIERVERTRQNEPNRYRIPSIAPVDTPPIDGANSKARRRSSVVVTPRRGDDDDDDGPAVVDTPSSNNGAAPAPAAEDWRGLLPADVDPDHPLAREGS